MQPALGGPASQAAPAWARRRSRSGSTVGAAILSLTTPLKASKSRIRYDTYSGSVPHRLQRGYSTCTHPHARPQARDSHSYQRTIAVNDSVNAPAILSGGSKGRNLWEGSDGFGRGRTASGCGPYEGRCRKRGRAPRKHRLLQGTHTRRHDNLSHSRAYRRTAKPPCNAAGRRRPTRSGSAKCSRTSMETMPTHSEAVLFI